jgi:ABC-type sugar transport system permease subunit
MIRSIKRSWDRFFRVFSPYLYVAPALILFSLFFAYPVYFGFKLSFHEWNGLTSINNMKFVGLLNFQELMTDPLFWKSFKNTVIFSVVTTALQMSISFLLAFTLWYYPRRINKALRAIIFFPGVVSTVILGLTWRKLLSSYGMVNSIFSGITGTDVLIQWLGNPKLVLGSIIVVDTWIFTGTNMILWLSGLLGIPADVIDAAKIDGANIRQMIRRVILPLLSHVTSLSLILNIIGGFQAFSTVYVMTRGGPAHSSEVLATYVFWLAFYSSGPQRFGYASAVAVIMIVILIVFSYFRVRASKVL